MDARLEKIISALSANKLTAGEHCIYVSICEQKLSVFENARLLKEYPISTSRAPASNVEGSLGTPCGLHKIDGKIGAGEPLDAVFVGRKNVGRVCEQDEQRRADNLIVSRILRLRGLEEGVNSGGNVDTYARCVYIHGTNRAEKLGEPNSHGCVLLSPEDAAEIFEIASDGDIVLISDK